jgi:hypothetical protein
MNIITNNPVMSQTDWEDEDYNIEDYSNASSSSRKARRSSRRTKRQEKGSFGERLKRGIGAVANSGVLDVLGGNSNTSQDSFDPNSMPIDTYVPPAPPKKGMSKGVKIAIGVGVVAIIGVTMYMLMKKKSVKKPS